MCCWPDAAFLTRLSAPAVPAVREAGTMLPGWASCSAWASTATEVGLLGIAARQAAQGMSPWQVMAFPALFTAGMALADTTDSVLMVGAYGWAFVNPLRMLWYNLTMTAASVLIAVLIGGIEGLGLVASRFALSGPPWDTIGDLNDRLGSFGFAVIGIFAVCWAVSAIVYRVKRYDLAEQGPG